MAEATTVAAVLPPAFQTALTVGVGIGGIFMPVLAFFWPRTPKPDTDTSRTVAAAVIAPLGDPNQLRQVVEELHKLNDYAFHLAALAEDVKDGLRDLKDGQRDLRDEIRQSRR